MIPTIQKEIHFLKAYIVPRWASVELRQMNPHAIEEWLQATLLRWACPEVHVTILPMAMRPERVSQKIGRIAKEGEDSID